MKISTRLSSLLILITGACVPTSLQAGSFGGPAPFQNGSPLVSGTDGVYQCVATGKNLTGIISWEIADGVQTATEADNTWIFFVDGQTLSGDTSANVSQGRVAGILDSGVSQSFATNGNGTITLPIAFVVPGNAGAGSFTGRIDLGSPVAAIDGKGILSGTPARTDQIVLIATDFVLGASVTIVPVTIPASDLDEVKFKIRGSRLNTGQ